MPQSPKLIAEARLFDELQKEHGYKVRALDLGMQTARDRFPMVMDRETHACTSLVSFVVSVPRDSSMGEAFVEYYGNEGRPDRSIPEKTHLAFPRLFGSSRAPHCGAMSDDPFALAKLPERAPWWPHSPWATWRRIRTGQMTAIRDGHRIYVTEALLRQYLAEHVTANPRKRRRA